MGVWNGSNNYRNQHASKISQDKNLWTNYIDEFFDVYIKSNRVKGFSYAHHYLLLERDDDWFRIAEWASPNNNGDPCHIFSCKKIEYHDCRYLGNYKLEIIIKAIKHANNLGDNDYNSITYNCNHWVENVASYLGETIKVSRNCNCIDGNLIRREIILKPQRTSKKISFQPMIIPLIPQQSIIQQPINYYNRQIPYNIQPINYYNRQIPFNIQPINYYNRQIPFKRQPSYYYNPNNRIIYYNSFDYN